jgi:hypothetical protein
MGGFCKILSIVQTASGGGDSILDDMFVVDPPTKFELVIYIILLDADTSSPRIVE